MWHSFLISFTWKFLYKNRFWLNTASLKIACLSKQRIHFSWEMIRKMLWLALIDLYNFFDFLIGVCVDGFFRTAEHLLKLTLFWEKREIISATYPGNPIQYIWIEQTLKIKKFLEQNLYITNEKQHLLPFYRQPPLYGLSLHLYIMISSFPILRCFKNLRSTINKTGVHTMKIY